MNNNELVLKELDKFSKKIDKLVLTRTPKFEDTYDGLYECDIYLFRHQGMGNSKQIIRGNKISILTAVSSLLTTLLSNNAISEKELDEMVKFVKATQSLDV